jgi:chromosomal replication initiation ATPase DnaA
VILKKVARHYGLSADRLRAKGNCGLEARNVAMWLVWERCGMSLREIGLARSLGEQGRKHVVEQFSADAILDRYESLYRRVKSENRSEEKLRR